jgi:hypothetical protein
VRGYLTPDNLCKNRILHTYHYRSEVCEEIKHILKFLT